MGIDFARLIEAAIRAKKSIADEKSKKEGNRGGYRVGQVLGTSQE